MAVEINQKKGMNKMKFTFMPEHFEWQYSDGSNSGSVNISYTAVPTESSPYGPTTEQLPFLYSTWEMVLFMFCMIIITIRFFPKLSKDEMKCSGIDILMA